MAQAGILVNLVMWAFNLFPLPPLDGGRILVGLLPWSGHQMVSRLEPWGFFIVMALVLAGIVLLAASAHDFRLCPDQHPVFSWHSCCADFFIFPFSTC